MYENDSTPLSPRDAYRLMLKDYPDVMDIGQMCAVLGISTKTGYKLLKDGEIAYLKIGRAYRIPKAHLLRYLKVVSPFNGYSANVPPIDAEN
ncbi:helix-turn-helix domain-containing protein [Flintibacter sp.]|uniref:helix-turn-helix domain-containing protein n=1 Tax=Flintibacter sp. TaxID=1918624 RepID=UPI003A2B9B12